MKKALFILLTITIGWIYTYGQSSVFFIPNWQKGEKHTYSISEIKEKTSSTDKGQTTETVSSDTNTYIAHFEVIDITNESYRIKMSYENNVDEIINELNIDDIHITIPEEYKEVDVIYTCDLNGVYQQIENVDEIQKNMKLLLDSILRPIAKENPLLLQIFGKIAQLYSTPEAIQTTAFKELQMFHFLYSYELVEDMMYPYDELLPNILTGEPLHATSIVYIDTINTEQSLCSVKRISSINEKDAKNMVKAYCNLLNANKAVKKYLKKMKIEIFDNYTWDYSTLLHMPLNVDTKRYTTVTIGNEISTTLEELQINFIE